MSKKWLMRLLTLVLVLSFVAACQPAATAAPTAAPAAAEPTKAPAAAEPTKAPEPTKVPEPTKAPEPSVLRVAISTTIDTFDAHGTKSFAVANVIDYMVETLVKADQQGNIVPWLAETWEFSDDGLEYTIHLRKGVTFSDGTPFDAAAVKYNIDRFNNPDVKSATKSPYNQVKEAVVVDENTVKFVVAKPSNGLFQAFSNTNIAMISPASIPVDSTQYKELTGVNAPIGTGAYVLKEYVKDDHVTVTRNPAYWGEKPYYDEVEFVIVPEAATRESLLLSGEVDVALAPPITDLAGLQNNPDVKVINASSSRVIFLGINTTTKYLDDPRVRQALNYAVDKEAIVKSVLLGYGDPLVSPMPKSFFGFCETTPSYKYDPEKAKALLKEAGVPEGLKLRFIAPTGRYLQDFQVSEAISGYLKAVGIDAVPETADWATYISMITGHKPADAVTDIYFLGWSGGYPHGSHTMSMFQTGAFFNGGFYSNPDLDTLIADADAAMDLTKAAELYCQANQTVWEDAPWVFLYQQPYPVLVSSKVDGVVVLASEKFETFKAKPVE